MPYWLSRPLASMWWWRRIAARSLLIIFPVNDGRESEIVPNLVGFR